MPTNWKLWRMNEVRTSVYSLQGCYGTYIETLRSSPDRESGLWTDLQCMQYVRNYTQSIDGQCMWLSVNISLPHQLCTSWPPSHFTACMHPLWWTDWHTFSVLWGQHYGEACLIAMARVLKPTSLQLHITSVTNLCNALHLQPMEVCIQLYTYVCTICVQCSRRMHTHKGINTPWCHCTNGLHWAWPQNRGSLGVRPPFPVEEMSVITTKCHELCKFGTINNLRTCVYSLSGFMCTVRTSRNTAQQIHTYICVPNDVAEERR